MVVGYVWRGLLGAEVQLRLVVLLPFADAGTPDSRELKLGREDRREFLASSAAALRQKSFDFAVDVVLRREELFVVVKETHARERERSIALAALVCLRMGLALRVALTSGAPARSAKMRRHQVGCLEDLACKSLKAIVTCLVFISCRVLHSYSKLHIHVPRSFQYSLHHVTCLS